MGSEPSVNQRTDDTAGDGLGFAATKEVCRTHARSFYFASHMLPRQKRDAAYAVYAFCRMMDDAIDDDDASIESATMHGIGRQAERDSSNETVGSVAGGEPSGRCDCACESAGTAGEGHRCGSCTSGRAEYRLTLFADRLADIYAGRLLLPDPANRSKAQHVLHAFGKTVHRYDIPERYFLDLAEGCRMDLSIRRYATWPALEKYCYHVAGVVGLIMSCVFGLTDPAAREQAVQMGNAMQLTNILRDMKEDLARGRVYLPQEDLARFGYGEKEIAAGIMDERLESLMRFEIERARGLYRSGSVGLCRLGDDRSRMTAASMAVIYAGILNAIERQGYDIHRSRAHLTMSEKLRRLPAAWRLAKWRPGEPMPEVFG